jgi:membrane protease YdiL (CAAX protease family)
MQLTLWLAGLLVLAILAAGIVSWVLASLKMAAGYPLIQWRKREAVPWGLLDLAGLFVLYFLAILAARFVLSALGWLPDLKSEADLTLADKGILVWANIGMQVGLLVVALPLIALHTGSSLSEFGLLGRHLLRDLKLGVIAFVMLAPPVYAIQGLLVYFWQPSKHPLMEMFKASPDAGFFAVLFVAAAVMAPIFEELVFRVLFQGFLEKLVSFRGHAAEILLGRLPSVWTTPAATLAPAPVEAGESTVVLRPTEAVENPYLASPVVADGIIPAELADPAEQAELRGFRSWFPIAIASIVFALLHYSHGPDWVALTLLAAGMGYLYQRTHSLVPSLVVHALINSLSMFGLWLQVYALPEQA